MLARKLEPPDGGDDSGSGGGDDGGHGDDPRSAQEVAEGRWRLRGRVPTKGPKGAVRWWERPAPGGDALLWEAVVRLHEQRQAKGVSVTRLAELVAARGHPIARETLSRVLNGLQPTSWATVQAMADVLDVSVDDLHARRGQPR